MTVEQPGRRRVRREVGSGGRQGQEGGRPGRLLLLCGLSGEGRAGLLCANVLDALSGKGMLLYIASYLCFTHRILACLLS